jgi:hypothetical protein
MQAYKKEELDNYFLVAEAKSLYSFKFIDKSQLAEIHNALLRLRTNDNILVRIAFFLLGSLLYSSIAGAFSVVFIEDVNGNSDRVLLFFYAIVGLIGSEFFAKNNFFRHGLDDAFILGFQLCFCLAVGIITDSVLLGLVAMIFVSAFCCVRYLHTLSILVFCLGILSVCFNLSVEQEFLNTVYLPFIGLLIAVILYFLSKRIIDFQGWYYYHEIAMLMKLFSLLLGYFSMNYMVVRELSQSIMYFTVTPENDIPFAFLFYGFTFIIPVFYIVFSLFKKDRFFLWVGLFTFGYSIFTIRFYYSLLPIEYAMFLGGIVIFIVSYLGIKYWKNKTEGITFIPDRSSDSKLLRNAQMLIITTQSKIDIPVSEDKVTFGGGGFSGGGAGESY